MHNSGLGWEGDPDLGGVPWTALCSQSLNDGPKIHHLYLTFLFKNFQKNLQEFFPLLRIQEQHTV